MNAFKQLIKNIGGGNRRPSSSKESPFALSPSRKRRSLTDNGTCSATEDTSSNRSTASSSEMGPSSDAPWRVGK
jgi:hypothetical protein